jgi:hypothetical protein
MKCSKCGHVWNEGQSGYQYRTCPKCGNTMKLPKICFIAYYTQKCNYCTHAKNCFEFSPSILKRITEAQTIKVV